MELPLDRVAAAGDHLAGLVRNTDIFILSDEVYEQLIFDGQKHYSVLEHPELRQVPTLTLIDSLRCVSLTLWDERARKLVPFPSTS